MAGYVDNNQEDMLNTGLDLATKLIYAVSVTTQLNSNSNHKLNLILVPSLVSRRF